jgi:RNA polymerase sigma-70 factor (ECF subfamily)
VTATNSSLQRARATIDAEVTPRAVAPRATHERALLERYVDVWERADIDGFVALLRDDAELRMPPRPSIVGAPALARFWFDPRGPAPCAAAQSRIVPTRANGRPAVVVYKRNEDGSEERFAVMLLETDGERITGFDAWLDPGLVERFEDERR